MSEHTETIQLDFDPTRISYQQLLDMFWKGHFPNGGFCKQYASAIFVHNEQQQQAAERSLANYMMQHGKPSTTIVRIGRFWWAEGYHQKYYLRSKPYMERFKDMPMVEFVNSTVATRLNGFVAGHGSLELLTREISTYGLSDAMKQKLLQKVEDHASSKRGLRTGC